MSNTNHVLVARSYPALLSIVLPIFNEEEMIPLLVPRLNAFAGKVACPVEFILVNDGSSDRSAFLLRDVAERDPRYKVLCLARNFGHQVAATAGLDAAGGEAIVLMDADLQDPPELVLEMLDKYQQGYDVVYARRIKREGETAFKRFTAWAFYRTMRTLVYKDLPPDVGDYRLVSRRCMDVLRQMRETHRFLRGMVSWVGFPQSDVTFVRPARVAGETKYPLHKMLKFAWTAAVSFSPAPLRMSFFVGLGLFGLGLVYGIYTFIRVMLGASLVQGWASLLVANFLTGGAVMIAIGVLGEYVARIFEEIKGRPLYVVSDTFNVDRKLTQEPAGMAAADAPVTTR